MYKYFNKPFDIKLPCIWNPGDFHNVKIVSKGNSLSHTLTINNSCRGWLVEVHEISNFQLLQIFIPGDFMKVSQIITQNILTETLLKLNTSTFSCYNQNLSFLCTRASEYFGYSMLVHMCLPCDPSKITTSIECLDI